MIKIKNESKKTESRDINVNIKEFAKQYTKEYTFLYDHYDNVAGYDEAVAAFDEFSETHGDFVGEFARYRGDFISSDREAAAFMFALEALGGFDDSAEVASRMATKPYKKVESLDDGAQYVLYKDLGGFKMTDKANYDSRISNAHKVMDFKEFDNIDEILDYAEKYLRIGRENVIITSSAKRESTTKARK